MRDTTVLEAQAGKLNNNKLKFQVVNCHTFVFYLLHLSTPVFKFCPLLTFVLTKVIARSVVHNTIP